MAAALYLILFYCASCCRIAFGHFALLVFCAFAMVAVFESSCLAFNLFCNGVQSR